MIKNRFLIYLIIVICTNFSIFYNNPILASGKIQCNSKSTFSTTGWKNISGIEAENDESYDNDYSKLIFNKQYSDPIIYSEEEILKYEKELGFKLPKLARKIYKNSIKLEYIRFDEYYNDIVINEIFSLEKVVKYYFLHRNDYKPNEDVIIFAYGLNDEYLYIDNDCIWTSIHQRNFIPHRLKST